MRARDYTDDIFSKVLDTFFENYERQENILRNGSNYVFDCVDITLDITDIVQSQTIEEQEDEVHTYHQQSGYQIRKQPFALHTQ